MTASKPDELSPDLVSELAYVRALAEEGRDAPLVGGFYYLLWGALMGGAAIIAFLLASGALSLGPVNIFSVWIGAGLIGWAASFLNGRRTGAKPGALTIGNRTAQAVWFSVGVFMTVLWIAIIFAHDNFTALGVPPYFLFSMMFPAAFGLYGVAFYASAVAARLGWLKGFALLSWGFAVACVFLAGSNYQFLAGGIGCIACAALPGWLLMRQEPQEIV